MTDPKKKHAVYFDSEKYPVLRLPEGSNLSEVLTICNSPVLFGCRTGICGTCKIRLDVVDGKIEESSAEERELLRIICAGDSRARLACQIRLTADIKISIATEDA